MLFEMVIDSGSTAWILTATCLVLIMTPGLAMFYGGLLRKKNVLAMYAFCFMAMFMISIGWLLFGYSIAFSESIGGLTGDLQLAGMNDIMFAEPVGVIPATVFAVFQCMFAIITAAILSSPFTDRAKFMSFGIFIFLWGILVYSPIAHWVWGTGGWLFELGALDFAGGTVVHVNVGFASLAVALVIGQRKNYQKEDMKPHNIPMILMGLGLLWMGWFGFNGGSALAANEIAGLAVLNTNIAACSAAVMWIFLESSDKTKGKPSLVGIATGVLAGLVGVTPAAGFVQPWAAFLIGIITTVPVYFMVKWRGKSKIDESLDAFACHGVGGVMGAILTGVFASVNGGSSLITGDVAQFGIQVLGVVVTAIYSFVVTLGLALAVKFLFGLRVSDQQEVEGLDKCNHGEEAYCEEINIENSSSGSITAASLVK
jgi:Amt family ammonium transporter